MSDNQHQIEGIEPKYYARIPNMIVDDLPYAELALYVHYKRIASDQGKCWQSTATIAKALGMTAKKLRATRDELVKRGLISVKLRQTDAGVEHGAKVIRILNVWESNVERFRPSPENDLPLPRNRPTPPPKTTHEENLLKKTQEEDSDSAPCAGKTDSVTTEKPMECPECDGIHMVNIVGTDEYYCADCVAEGIKARAAPMPCEPTGDAWKPDHCQDDCVGYPLICNPQCVFPWPDPVDGDEPPPVEEVESKPTVKPLTTHQALFGAIRDAMTWPVFTKSHNARIGKVVKQLCALMDRNGDPVPPPAPAMIAEFFKWLAKQNYDSDNPEIIISKWPAFMADYSTGPGVLIPVMTDEERERYGQPPRPMGERVDPALLAAIRIPLEKIVQPGLHGYVPPTLEQLQEIEEYEQSITAKTTATDTENSSAEF